MIASSLARTFAIAGLILLIGNTALAQYHSADTTPDQQISLTELLRVTQFYDSSAHDTECGTEDDFAPVNRAASAVAVL